MIVKYIEDMFLVGDKVGVTFALDYEGGDIFIPESLSFMTLAKKYGAELVSSKFYLEADSCHMYSCIYVGMDVLIDVLSDLSENGFMDGDGDG
jgi:hypothetical protein